MTENIAQKKSYIPLVVSLAVGALLISVLVVRLTAKTKRVAAEPNEFVTFYKTLSTKAQAYFK